MHLFFKICALIFSLIILGCSTTPNLDQNFGKSIKESLSKQVVDSKESDKKDTSVQYPFTTNLMK